MNSLMPQPTTSIRGRARAFITALDAVSVFPEKTLTLQKRLMMNVGERRRSRRFLAGGPLPSSGRPTSNPLLPFVLSPFSAQSLFCSQIIQTSNRFKLSCLLSVKFTQTGFRAIIILPTKPPPRPRHPSSSSSGGLCLPDTQVILPTRRGM